MASVQEPHSDQSPMTSNQGLSSNQEPPFDQEPPSVQPPSARQFVEGLVSKEWQSRCAFIFDPEHGRYLLVLNASNDQQMIDFVTEFTKSSLEVRIEHQKIVSSKMIVACTAVMAKIVNYSEWYGNSVVLSYKLPDGIDAQVVCRKD